MDLAVLMVFAGLTSAWVAALVIQAAHRLHFGTDEPAGVQKFHAHPVSRLGGIAVFVGLFASLLLLAWYRDAGKAPAAFLIICLLPAFGMGLVEDVTRRAGVLARLIATMLSAALGWWLFKAGLFRIAWDPVDDLLLTYPAAALIMTLLAAAGSAQALNIIDGCNGFSSFFVMAALAALAFVAAQVGDVFVLQTALLALAATAGFFVWNFPHGRIFLGDAGAYMLGFLVAQLAMILITRHPQVSPWFAMLILAYPAWETLFSMYRRARRNWRYVGQPDALHLHQLVYRRILKWAPAAAGVELRARRSALTSMLLWPLMLMCMLPAVLFWNQSRILFGFCLLFAFSYVVIYFAIVRFRVPPPLRRLLAHGRQIWLRESPV